MWSKGKKSINVKNVSKFLLLLSTLNLLVDQIYLFHFIFFFSFVLFCLFLTLRMIIWKKKILKLNYADKNVKQFYYVTLLNSWFFSFVKYFYFIFLNIILLFQMSLFTFFSAVCVVLQMIGTILTGDAGGLLRSLVMCEKEISGPRCKCCESEMACYQGVGVVEFEGVQDCSVITGLLTGLLYGLCVLTIFGSLLCFIATILGCTAVARQTSRHQVRGMIVSVVLKFISQGYSKDLWVSVSHKYLRRICGMAGCLLMINWHVFWFKRGGVAG